MTFDTTVNVSSLVAVGMVAFAIVAAWFKFGGRLDMIEYRVKSIEDTLKILSETLKSIAETDKKMAVMDGRQLAMENSYATLAQTIEGLRHGDGYIQARRGNVDGEYKR
jgi:hypothetical protein